MAIFAFACGFVIGGVIGLLVGANNASKVKDQAHSLEQTAADRIKDKL